MAVVDYLVVDGVLLAENRGGTKSDYVPDPLGSTVSLVNNSQTQTDTFSYWPYWEEKDRTGTTPTPFRFGGKSAYFRDSSSLVYVRARHLSTTNGKWNSMDPLMFRGGDVNLLRYCYSSPVTRIDPVGLQTVIDVPPTNVPYPRPYFPPPSPPTSPGSSSGGSGAWYGQYCGPQTKPGIGAGKDPMDKCCKAHDECFAANRPPCNVVNQAFFEGCIRCNDQLCFCASNAPCSNMYCMVFKPFVLIYACGTSFLQPGFGFPIYKDPLGGLPKACPRTNFPAI